MGICNVVNRTMFLHDNLDVLQHINSESIDLIYFDPPFNKNKVFAAPIGSSAEGAEFKDIFRREDLKDEWLQTIKEDQPELHNYLNGIKGVGKAYNFAYLAYMAIRLIECQRILKRTGSIYLHCDPTMSHYLKTTMDCIYGEDRFRNEVIWRRYGSHNDAKRYGRVTDTLLFYTREDATWNSLRIPLSEEDIRRRYTNKDERGLYTTSPLHARTLAGGGYKYTWNGITDVWKFPPESLDRLDKEGQIHWPKRGRIPRRKIYLSENPGKPLSNLWSDISIAAGKERTGYPTQKPLALLERIIQVSSNEGDMVLDPFCGCATTCIAAERLRRQWIGIDVSSKAYDLVKTRLEKEVARPDELYGEEVHLTTKLPVRLDLGDAIGETKHVYIISHPNFPGEYKVGIAKNVRSRLNAYQTSDPDRAYKLEFSHETHLFRETEKHIHDTFDNKHEWVSGEIAEIKREIEGFGEDSN